MSKVNWATTLDCVIKEQYVSPDQEHGWQQQGRNLQPSEQEQIVVSIALICTASCQILASASTNQGPKKGDLIRPAPASGARMAAAGAGLEKEWLQFPLQWLQSPRAGEP